MPVHFPKVLAHGHQPGAGFSALGIPFRDANTGAGQNFTGLTTAVQLRLRVAVFADGRQGLQSLTVKSRLLTGENSVRIRGNPPFPHPW